MLCLHGRGVVCHECHDTISRLCADLNESNDEIARLRAELEGARKLFRAAVADYEAVKRERDEACRDRDRAMAERAVARADLARMTRALADERAAVAIAHERIAEVTAERDARVPLASLPTEFVAGEWIMSGEAEPDAVVTYARVPSPETGHVGWCWWARGKMGDARDYVAAREAAEKALRAHAAGSGAADASDGPFGPVSDWLSKLPSIKRESLGTWRANDCAACEGSGYANVRASAAGARTCPACNGTGRKGGPNA